MATAPSTHVPPAGWGMLSLVLGTIGLMLSPLPVLGVPISGVAVIFGVIGCVAAWQERGSSLRSSLVGLALSALALGVNIAIHYAPIGYITDRPVPEMWQPVPDRPTVPPPMPLTPVQGMSFHQTPGKVYHGGAHCWEGRFGGAPSLDGRAADLGPLGPLTRPC